MGGNSCCDKVSNDDHGWVEVAVLIKKVMTWPKYVFTVVFNKI